MINQTTIDHRTNGMLHDTVTNTEYVAAVVGGWDSNNNRLDSIELLKLDGSNDAGGSICQVSTNI